jgi:hypothetical protein
MPEIKNLISSAALWTLFLGEAASCVAASGEEPPAAYGAEYAQVLEVKDTALVGKIWRGLYPDSVLPRGEYQILIPDGIDPATSGPSGTVFLLRDGTEIGHFSAEDWHRMSAGQTNPGWWKRALDVPETHDAPTVWRALGADLPTWLGRGEWPAGFKFGVGSALSALPSTGVQFERQIDFEWTQKMLGHYLLGAGLHRTQYGGGVTHNAESRAALSAGDVEPDFWGKAYWWWSVSAGLPFLRYTAYLADRPLPRYYWLEPRADSLIRNHQAGRVVNQWEGSTMNLNGNWANTLDFRLSYFRYSLDWDGDAYAAPIHSIEMAELPAFFGSWGAGLVASSGIAFTRFWVDIPDLAFSIPYPQSRPSDFRLAFLRLDFTYRNLRNFSLGLAVTVKLGNPIFNLPGA